MNELIIYGDIHGCYDEFISLRNQINPQSNDIEICVGDIVTKGKNSIKTLDYIIENGIKSVLGNHEDKIIRYLNHQKLNQENNPIKLDSDEQNIVNSLTQGHIDFLQKMPLYLKFGDVTIVHAGLENSMNLESLSKRNRQKILRIRYLDESLVYLTLGKENDKSIFWADVYDGNQGFVVYGHQPFDEVKKSEYALGIDTGCVYGNKLSAVVFDMNNTNLEYKIFSVKGSR